MCQSRLYIKRGKWEGKENLFFSCPLFRSKATVTLIWNLITSVIRKYPANFPLLKKKTTAPSVEFKEEIQISGSVRAIEMEAVRNSSIATVKDPSANFHASLPSLLSRHAVMVGVGDFVVGL